tara:strand:+ start:9378 stop:9698 length:321 start_codon:yes stop_codon:yes gene_type:complete
MSDSDNTFTISENGVVRTVTMTAEDVAAIARVRAEYAVANAAARQASQRRRRNELLGECDWVVLRKTERDVDIPSEWITYRQALRDLPTHTNWPELEEADWPTKPE